MNKKNFFIIFFLIIFLLNFNKPIFSQSNMQENKIQKNRFTTIKYDDNLFLLDSATGRIWIMLFDEKQKEHWFKELIVFDNESSIPYLRVIKNAKKRISENQKLKEQKTSKKRKWIEEIMGEKSKKKEKEN